MKVSDAPRAGWYPDPEGAVRLRWWDGSDWSDRYRLRPLGSQTQGELETQALAPQGVGDQAFDPAQLGNAMHLPPQTAAVVEQVRLAARAEAQRAAQDFEARARRITGEIPPLISQYTNRFMRWFKVLLTLSFIVLMAWFIYQFFVQKSIFDWLGDRIDNITDDENAFPLPSDPREAVVVLSH
jgi:hypothetical protein